MTQFIHITDTHLLDTAEQVHKGYATYASLKKIVDHCIQHSAHAEFILFTGDISQTGNAESYQLFETIIRRFKVPVYCVPGNHDNPEKLSRIIPTCPSNTVVTISLKEHKLILLNTAVPDEEYGVLSETILNDLAIALLDQTPAIVALHHPPINVDSSWMDRIGLLGKETFMEIVARFPQIELILFGHVHQTVDQRHGDTRLLATPSTCYQFETHSETMKLADLPPAYRFVKISSNKVIETQVHRLT